MMKSDYSRITSGFGMMVMVLGLLMATLPIKAEAKQNYAAVDDVECMAMNIYFEARSEPHRGKVAVARVTKNRVNSKLYPDSVCAVVWQKQNKVCQFSWTCDGIPDRIRDYTVYREALKIAHEVLHLDKYSDILSRNVYNFHSVSVNPKWADRMSFVTQIGNHKFYRF